MRDAVKIAVGLLLLPAMAGAQEIVSLPMDRPVQIGSAEAVCTGVSLDARENPAWAAYPLRVEIAGRGGQYLADMQLTLSAGGKTVASVRCDGPWVLFKVPPGRYQLEAETEGKKAVSNAFPPASGQGRIILRFPDLGGDVTPPAHRPS